MRSQKPEGIEEEVRGALIVYNLVRPKMTGAGVQTRVEPGSLSFRRTLQILLHEMIRAAGMASRKRPAYRVRLRAQMQFSIVEKRRGRRCPRLVKALAKR